MRGICKKPKLNKYLKNAEAYINKDDLDELIKALEELHSWAVNYNKLNSDNKFEFEVEYVEL